MNWWLNEAFLRSQAEPAGGTPDDPPPVNQDPPATDPNADPKSLVSKDPTEPADPAPAPEPLTREALSLPEGVEVSDELMNEFIDLFNKDMPAAERANALIALQIKTQEEAGNALAEVWNQTQEEWRGETQAALGENLDKSLAGIRQLVDEYAVDSEKLLEAMDLTGAGNHPAVVTFLAKIAEVLVKEGEPVSGAPSSAPQDRAHRMFPNMN